MLRKKAVVSVGPDVPRVAARDFWKEVIAIAKDYWGGLGLRRLCHKSSGIWDMQLIAFPPNRRW